MANANGASGARRRRVDLRRTLINALSKKQPDGKRRLDNVVEQLLVGAEKGNVAAFREIATWLEDRPAGRQAGGGDPTWDPNTPVNIEVVTGFDDTVHARPSEHEFSSAYASEDDLPSAEAL